MVLLQLISGRKIIDSKRKEKDESLRQWVCWASRCDFFDLILSTRWQKKIEVLILCSNLNNLCLLYGNRRQNQ